MRRISIILGVCLLALCVVLIARAAGQFVDSQAQALKDRTQIAR